MILLTRPSFRPSARVLRRGIPGLSIRIVNDLVPVIRWGNSDRVLGDFTELNSADKIGIVSNKRRFSNEMTRIGISHVEINRGEPDKFPVVVRTTISGFGGRGIVVCKNLEEFTPYRDYFWSYWYNFTFELGVHLLGGKVAKLFIKKSTENEQEEFPIRNSSRGYDFKLILPESWNKYTKLFPTVENFFDKFPINMCRLDVGWDNDNKLYRIIECNSAPGLSENQNTANLYINYIRSTLGV